MGKKLLLNNKVLKKINMKYKLAAMGGTFDRLHKGHKTLIKHAFSQADKVYIGITNDEMGRKRKNCNYCIQSFDERKKQVEEFVSKIEKKDKVKIVKLNNIFGPTLTDKSIDLLVCSPLTKSGADLINQSRVKRNLKELPIEICLLEKSPDGKHISSTRIRKGEIARDGFIYSELFDKDIEIGEKLKNELKKPQGLLVKNDLVHINTVGQLMSRFGLRIAVGDIASWFIVKNNIYCDLLVFDNKTERKELVKKLEDVLDEKKIVEYKNQSGIITKGLYKKIGECLFDYKYLKIVGEEDLAVLPAICFCPLDSTIIYGQPGEGLVVIKVGEKEKERVREWLN